jgi:hypothetical protein
LILKFKKKYRQNRREKLRRTMYFSADSEFHATTLLLKGHSMMTHITAIAEGLVQQLEDLNLCLSHKS